MALSETEKRKNFLKKHGLKRFNTAVRTTEGGKTSSYEKTRGMAIQKAMKGKV